MVESQASAPKEAVQDESGKLWSGNLHIFLSVSDYVMLARSFLRRHSSILIFTTGPERTSDFRVRSCKRTCSSVGRSFINQCRLDPTEHSDSTRVDPSCPHPCSPQSIPRLFDLSFLTLTA